MDIWQRVPTTPLKNWPHSENRDLKSHLSFNGIEKAWLLSFKKTTTPVYGSCAVLRLSPIQFNGAAVPGTTYWEEWRCFCNKVAMNLHCCNHQRTFLAEHIKREAEVEGEFIMITEYTKQLYGLCSILSISVFIDLFAIRFLKLLFNAVNHSVWGTYYLEYLLYVQ